MGLWDKIDNRIHTVIQTAAGAALQAGFDQSISQSPPVDGIVDISYNGGPSALINLNDGSQQTLAVGTAVIRANDRVTVVGGRIFA